MKDSKMILAIDLAYVGETACVIFFELKNTWKTVYTTGLYNKQNQLETYKNIEKFCNEIKTKMNNITEKINIILEISDFQATVHYEFVAGMILSQLIKEFNTERINSIKRIHSNVWQKYTKDHWYTNNEISTWKDTKKNAIGFLKNQHQSIFDELIKYPLNNNEIDALCMSLLFDKVNDREITKQEKKENIIKDKKKIFNKKLTNQLNKISELKDKIAMLELDYSEDKKARTLKRITRLKLSLIKILKNE